MSCIMGQVMFTRDLSCTACSSVQSMSSPSISHYGILNEGVYMVLNAVTPVSPRSIGSSSVTGVSCRCKGEEPQEPLELMERRLIMVKRRSTHAAVHTMGQ